MAQSVEQVLQKISFIEQDIELHKSILVSIPKDQEGEMEKVIGKIKQMKDRVQELKGSIAEIDPEVHAHILQLEEGTRKFQEVIKSRELRQVITLDQAGECRVDLVDGRQFECLVKAMDEKGNWTALTLDGEVLEFGVEEIMEL